MRQVLCTATLVLLSALGYGEETDNPLRTFNEQNALAWYLPEEPDGLHNLEAYAPYVYHRFTVDLNDDGQPDYFLANHWTRNLPDPVPVDWYCPFISEGKTYWYREANMAVLPLEPTQDCFLGRLKDSNKPAIFNYAFYRNNINVCAHYIDGHELKTQIEEHNDLEDVDAEFKPIDKAMHEKYQVLKREEIPLALMETLWQVQGDLEEYLKKREAAVYTDPVRDFRERHRKYFGEERRKFFGEERAAGHELLIMKRPPKGDGKKEQLWLSTSTLDAGDVLGYDWEVYTKVEGGYRWTRETRIAKPGEGVAREPLLDGGEW